MSQLTIKGPTSPINAHIHIGGSKSISNRVLLIRALSQSDFKIDNLSDSDDTQTMLNLLLQENLKEYDCHHAGTTFRFLTAFLAMQKSEQMLTGSSRMQQRPIGPLVDALRSIGAEIDYVVNEGFPPLKIKPFKRQIKNEINIKADISSQFISALCMIAPNLENGLRINFIGDLVSRPYLEMTLSIMSSFGIDSTFGEDYISIDSQSYKPQPYLVESDWSSASYHYAIASLLPGSKITLSYYFKNSLQGDSKMADMAKSFGVTTSYVENKIILESLENHNSFFNYDFIRQPDIAQTISVMGAAKNMHLQFKGLKTLRIKETDRILALQQELNKVNINLFPSSDKNFEFEQSGNIVVDNPIFETYQDHRMAMAFAPLAILGPISFNNPEVVSKSYPRFWEDLLDMGFLF